MEAVSLLGLVLLVLCPQLVRMQEYDYEDYEESPQNCSTREVIKDGNVSYTQAGIPGSVLSYHCGRGQYPYPVSHRHCEEDGEWSTMRLANGRPVSQARCKNVLCPGQVQLDHGEFWPRDQWLRPGEAQTFFCHEGFTLRGSAQRNCTLAGQWTGTNPLCEGQADDCGDPGIPPGGLRTAGRFRVGDRVQYRCQSGLDLLGSAERVCLEAQEWSGSEPRCQAPFAFDSPSFVAEAIGGSLSGIMDVLSPEFKKKIKKESFGRSMRVADGRMNIFILLDTSGSITDKQFEAARRATIALIRRLDSYEVQMRFQVTSFASKAHSIISILDPGCDDVDSVIERLNEFDPKSHEGQTGTNLHAALAQVYENMLILKDRQPEHFSHTQNVILIETDGYSNTGANALERLLRIRHLLGYETSSTEHSNEDLLDVYVFGLGDKVNKKELNDIASKKRDEQHLFILQNAISLEEVFHLMISDKSVTMCGVAHERLHQYSQELHKISHTRPWHVKVITTGSKEQNCLGSIVSQNWVLTAAHCFSNMALEKLEPRKITIEYEGGTVKAKEVLQHPQYDVRGLKNRNVQEFYDYDIALVKVEESIPLSSAARPICLPCTKAGTRAMKMSPSSTCKDHLSALFPNEETRAYFFHDTDRKQTHIHTGKKRADCIKPAERILTQATNVTLEEYIPDRFLCTGGTPSHQDHATCKGDSGGPLYLTKRMRSFQVGVVSWGIVDVCRATESDKNSARDFHISVFQVVPWLQQHLATEIDFLPADS